MGRSTETTQSSGQQYQNGSGNFQLGNVGGDVNFYLNGPSQKKVDQIENLVNKQIFRPVNPRLRDVVTTGLRSTQQGSSAPLAVEISILSGDD